MKWKLWKYCYWFQLELESILLLKSNCNDNLYPSINVFILMSMTDYWLLTSDIIIEETAVCTRQFGTIQQFIIYPAITDSSSNSTGFLCKWAVSLPFTVYHPVTICCFKQQFKQNCLRKYYGNFDRFINGIMECFCIQTFVTLQLKI